MSYLNNPKNRAPQLLGLALAMAMLTSLFAVPSYSASRAPSSASAITAASGLLSSAFRGFAQKLTGRFETDY